MKLQYGRRRFLTVSGKGVLGAALLAAEASTAGFLLTGCAVTIDDVVNWTNAGASAIEGVLTLLTMAGVVCAVCAVAAPIAEAAIHAIAGAIQEWEAAPAAQKATTWDKVKLAMQVAIDQVKAFFAGVNIPVNPIVSTILSIASLVLSTLSGFLAQFFPTLSLSLAEAKLGATPIPVTPKSMSHKDFAKAFNAITASAGYPKVVLK